MPSRGIEDEARRGFSGIRSTQANAQSVEEVEREKPDGRADRTTQQVFMNSPG